MLSERSQTQKAPTMIPLLRHSCKEHHKTKWWWPGCRGGLDYKEALEFGVITELLYILICVVMM